MHLYRSQYARPVGKKVVKIDGKGDPKTVRPERRICVEREIGYWRKANQIHKWFVDNVQEGQDDCREYEVCRDQLSQLQEIVQQVLDNSKLKEGKVSVGLRRTEADEYEKILEDGRVIQDPSVAKALLPVQSGFFFGGTDYDQWYLEDLQTTSEILETALASDDDARFTYRSSW